MISKFTITSKILSYVAEIAELTGGINMAEKLNKNPTLRRANRIQTVHVM